MYAAAGDVEIKFHALLPGATVVLDCSDNYATRHAVNAACVRHGKPLVIGAVIRFDGQITVVDPRDAASPCYACVFPPDAVFEEVQCSTMGVFAPLVGVVGAMQAAEALKLVADIGESLNGRLLLLDAMSMNWRTVKFRQDADCAVCRPSSAVRSGEYLHQSGEHHESAGAACHPAPTTPAG